MIPTGISLLRRYWSISVKIDEDVTRINAMLTLLMSNINEEGSKIQKLAERMFANLKHRKSPLAVAN
ncbi:hypothetical protein RIF29_29572 [Crotalaria pallida]|uniref:Uncharacterized protein n=1 Tax=Crotalaria pallida TaxID=3830 RepID=A0AAN9EF05_CROPI